MGYHHLDAATLPPSPDHPCDRRPLSEAAALTTLHLATYKLAPGEDLAHAYHYHEVREEAFHVLEGPLHVETPDEDYVVRSGETFVVEPSSPIRPHNPEDADGSVRVLGAGAPKTDPAHLYER